MAIQNDNTLVTKGDLKDIYTNKIAPYLGANLQISTNNLEYYSTSEKIIGIWIDGKPLYQKVIDCGQLPNATTKNVNHGISNLDKVIDVTGYTTEGTYFTTFPRPGYSDNIYACNAEVYPTYITLWTGTDQRSRTAVVILKYTKTTDVAGSATTTPGAYDINFPNTWPENTEIYFGNGLYGQRFTGTITATANSFARTPLLSSSSTPLYIKNWGGEYVLNNVNGERFVIGSTWQDNAYNNGIDNSTYSGGAITFGNCSGAVRTNAPYDIWVTYTK